MSIANNKILFPLFTPFFCCLISWWVLGEYFHIYMLPLAKALDLFVFIVYSILLSYVSRSNKLHSAIIALCIAIMMVGSGIKLNLLGSPIKASDTRYLISLLEILEGWRFYSVIGLLLFLAIAILINVKVISKNFVLIVFFFGFIFAVPVTCSDLVLSLHKEISSGEIWDEKSNFESSGFWLYLYSQEAMRKKNQISEPNESKVANILENKYNNTIGNNHLQRRNIHLLLVESLWDPLLLKGIKYNRDPIHEEFRKLLVKSRSQVLVPVFGGKTANSEFEVLCGLPAGSHMVEFVTTITKPVPCLPRFLKDIGYKSIANHPNQKNFWGRVGAYRNLGFQEYLSIDSFSLEDSNYGEFISDESLLKQVKKNLHGEKSPVFNYVVTISGHYPYGLNAERRPRVIKTSPFEKDVEDYANSIYYTTKELGEFINDLTKDDPTSLMVIVGDHLPAFDRGIRTYTDYGYFSSVYKRFGPNDFVNYSSTPLLIIDSGKVRSVGTIPLYEVPSEILRLIGSNQPLMPWDIIPKPTVDVIRTYDWGLLLNNDEVCLRDKSSISANCQNGFDYIDKLLMIKSDILNGSQYSLNYLSLSRLNAKTTKMIIDKNEVMCEFSVDAFGPTIIELGKAFNVQPSGKSALWFSGVKTTRKLVVSIDNQFFDVVMNHRSMSASHFNPKFVNSAGEYELLIGCDKDSLRSIGRLTVK